MPTETVYGLAARIDQPQALELIFSTKQRPFFDPLIVHVSSIGEAKRLTTQWGAAANALAARFWPGPLTLILPKNSSVNPMITSGLESVGIRCPDHPMALELISKVGVPLAAPSANRFGKTSPTSAEHVEIEFASGVPVIDGGSSSIGIESTVLWLNESGSTAEWKILRPGHISSGEIQTCLAEAKIAHRRKEDLDAKASPGQMKHHYMPEIPLIMVLRASVSLQEVTTWANSKIGELPDQVEGVTLNKPSALAHGTEFVLPRDPILAARALYAQLREQSRLPTDHLIFFQQPYHGDEAWMPLMDRLKKASSLVFS